MYKKLFCVNSLHESFGGMAVSMWYMLARFEIAPAYSELMKFASPTHFTNAKCYLASKFSTSKENMHEEELSLEFLST